MRRIGLGLALAIALSVGSFSSGAAAEKYQIDSEIWGGYQVYLRSIANGNKPGAFAITEDGRNAFYTWCEGTRCVAGTTYSHDAVSNCEQEYGRNCVVFAIRDEIQVEYEIIGRATVTADPPELEPAPVTTVAVTADVQSEIDTYLGNVKSAGRVWAFAIAKDGADSAMASCPAVSSRNAGPCSPVLGGAQELAKREAIKRCGGPTDCVLLYVGPNKAANIEIVAR